MTVSTIAIAAWLFVSVIVIPIAAMAASDNEELDRANLEAAIARGFSEAAQLRMEAVTLRKQIAEMRTKCGDPCAPPKPDVKP